MSEELRGRGGVPRRAGRGAGGRGGADQRGDAARWCRCRNTGCDRGTLEERVEAAVGDRPALVFVDMASGSCLFAVLNRLRAEPRARS